MKKILILVLTVLLFGLGIFVGYKIFGLENSEPKITREVLLTSLKSEGFLVSQVAILNEQVEIDRSTGSAFKDFFWGQDITASANIKVSSGIDLTKLSGDDIKISDSKIEIELPAITTHSVELLDNIQLYNKQGILKKLFDNDDGYNDALTQLKDAARVAAEKQELRSEAEASAKQEIERLIRFIDSEKEIVIKIKERNGK